MSSSPKPVIVITSLQIQTSFQAVPLGAACIVSALKADPDVAPRSTVMLADFSLEETEIAMLSPHDAGALIAKKIAAIVTGEAGGTVETVSVSSPVFIGFSVYVWNRAVLEIAAAHLRHSIPSAVLFAGGPEVTANPKSFSIQSALSSDGVFNYLVCGEGESATCALINAVLDKKSVPASISACTRCPSEDCSSLPSPWLDGTLDASPSVRECKGALWELARGCPYNCAYCYESKGDKKVRTFPLERLEKELDYFVASGIERVFVLDPTYNASRERALSLLRLIEKKGGELHFNFELRAEHLDREMAEAFGKIPCSLQIGLQSTNPEALKLVKRPVDLAQFTKKIALLNDVGIVFGLDLMYGLPGDSLSTFRSSIDYAVGLYPNNLEIFRLAVLPGTDLADRADTLGLKALSVPPYHVESSPKFPLQDLERASLIARACDIFYTQGRAVTWFLSMLHPIKLKPAQFFQDFAQFLAEDSTRTNYAFLSETRFLAGEKDLSQREAEMLQLSFTEKKYREKEKAFLLPIIRDIISLNGAWTRALAEGDETTLSLSYHPDDLFSPDAIDLEYFTDNAYMENCTVRIFAGPDGPDMEIS